MKKYLIKQTKKSISLFLAVLMVLSCWVWIAPTEAEAVDQTCADLDPADKYKIILGYNVSDAYTHSDDAYIRFKVWYRKNNGTGDETGPETKEGTIKSTGNKTVEFTVDGFPYYVEANCYRNTATSTKDIKFSVSWNSMEIQNSTGTVKTGNLIGGDSGLVYSYSQSTGSKWVAWKGFRIAGYANPTVGEREAGDTVADVNSASAPYVAGFDSASRSKDSIALTLNKMGGVDVSGSTEFTYGTLFDQYGVKWKGSTYTFGSTVKNTIFGDSENATDNISGDEATYLSISNTDTSTKTTSTVSAKPGLQTVLAGKDEGHNYHIVSTWEAELVNGKSVKSKITCPVNIKFSKYDVSFKGEGSISGLAYQMKYNDTATNKTVTTNATITNTGYYNADYTKIPTGEISANGYTFKGFWTEPQPGASPVFGDDDKIRYDASYNSKNDEFAEPCSSEDFKKYKTSAEGDESTDTFVNGRYVICDSNKDGELERYYDAGEPWNPEVTQITGDNTYRGWWISKDLEVRFYDIDGSYLGKTSVKYGQTNNDITWPTPKLTYTSGAFSYGNFSGVWKDKNGDKYSQTGCTFKKDLIMLTPTYEVNFDNKYSVTFKGLGGDTLAGSSDNFVYRADITEDMRTASQLLPATPPAKINDVQYGYNFIGWTTTVPTEGNYHVVLEDADFEVNSGAQIICNNDWIVRTDATYYAVYRRYTYTYVLEFVLTDATGGTKTEQAKIKFGEDITVPDSFINQYIKNGYAYDFEEWEYSAKSGKKVKDINGLKFTDENINISKNAIDDGKDVTPISFTAKYQKGKPTPYTITFESYDGDGKKVVQYAEVNNETFITDDIKNTLNPAEKWDNDNKQYTFANTWEVVDGAGLRSENSDIDDAYITPVKVGDIIKTEDLVKFSPTSKVIFRAVYDNPIDYYTVTYVDGKTTESIEVLYGDKIPAWTVSKFNDNGTPEDTSDDFYEDVPYVPEMAETAKGKYVFQGWFNEAQTDETFSQTNGEEYPADYEVTSDITLYSQFIFEAFKYRVEFKVDAESDPIAWGDFEYGHYLSGLQAQANAAARIKASDERYNYEFVGWDNSVPEICEGKALTFIAVYKRSNRYYDVKWYNSKLDGNGNWVASEDDLLATTKHTYESKLYTPSVSVTCLETPADNSKSYYFAGWAYKVDGEEFMYKRGMTITSGMEFYAKFELSTKASVVTTIVNGESKEYQVPYNSVAENIYDPSDIYVDAPLYGEDEDGNAIILADTYHKEFVKWYTDSNYANEFDIENTKITGDITLYAKFEDKKHNIEENEQIITVPTYYVEGLKANWCSCNATETRVETVLQLTDTKAPTGEIRLADKVWSSTGDFADDTINLVVNAKDGIVVTIRDTGDYNENYNPGSLGKGIELVRVFAYPASVDFNIDRFNASQESATVVFYDDSTDATNYVDYIVRLADLNVVDLDENGDLQYDENNEVKTKKLTDGEEYIVYYYAVDKAGNKLNSKVRTSKFLYDASAPEMTITAEHVGKNAGVSKTPEYCEGVTVELNEAATLKVDGVTVDLTATDVDGKTVYVYEIELEADKVEKTYLIEATDSVGNSRSKKIKISAHKYSDEGTLPTCTTGGYKKEICSICGDEKTNETYPALGHSFGDPKLVPATCSDNAYIVYGCSACAYEIEYAHLATWTAEVDENTDYVLDAANNTVSKTVENEVQYLVYVIDDEGNRTDIGLSSGHSYPTEEDAEGNQVIKFTVVTPATCMSKGKKVSVCELCGDVTSAEIEIDDNAHIYSVTKVLDPTCTEDGMKYQVCKLCSYMNVLPDELLATGHEETHWVVTTEPTCVDAGVETEKCTKCGATIKTDGVDNTRPVPATNEHIYELTSSANNVNTYKCKVCDDIKTTGGAVVNYTVIFNDEDGDEIKKVTVKGGETLAAKATSATDDKFAPEAPEKEDETGRFKYKFAGWVDADGKKIKFPLTVTADMTLTVSYTESKKLYTHQFVVPNTKTALFSSTDEGYRVEGNLIGALDDEVKLNTIPSFALENPNDNEEFKDQYTVKFKYWAEEPRGEEAVHDFTVTYDEDSEDANRTFYAVFDVVAKEYVVSFVNGATLVWSTTVNAGSGVVFGGTEPTKAPDNNYHYSFNGWYVDAACKIPYTNQAIKADKTTIYAGFTAIPHNFDNTKGAVIQPQTCELGEKTKYTCECGEEKVVQTKAPKGHDYNVVGVPSADGLKIEYYCANGCGDFITTKNAFTVSFTIDGITDELYTVPAGEKVKFTGEKPTKSATSQYSYEFEGWKILGGGDTVYALDYEFAATEDITLVAQFKATTCTYRVTYYNAENGDVLQTFDNIAYGANIPAYTDTEIPTKAPDAKGHYVFTGWDRSTSETVKGDTVIYPVFKLEDHKYGTSQSIKATCEDYGQEISTCTVAGCNYKKSSTTLEKPLGHTDVKANETKVEHKIVEIDGKLYDVYTCTRCNAEQKNEIRSKKITIAVFDKDGKEIKNGAAKVTITNKDDENDKATTYTKNGVAEFIVPADKKVEWIVTVVNAEGYDTLPKGGYYGELGTSDTGLTFGKDNGSDSGETTGCTCTCHKKTFWGILFNFFQKIIRFFNKNAKCCDCYAG